MSDTAPKNASNNNTLLVILVIIMAFFTGYLWNKVKTLEKKGTVEGASEINTNTQPVQKAQPVEQNQQTQETAAKNLTAKKPSPQEDHWRGVKSARYVWIEYSDLECPFCQKIHPDLIKMVDEYKNKVAWVYRHFPLPGHPKAQKSAEATECTADQKGNDGFWKMTDLIFEKMPNMELSDLPDLAASIGLDKSSFQSCLDSGKYASTVQAQASEGNTIGIRATPTGIIYDMKTGKSKTVEGALPFESLQSELTQFMQ